MRKSELEDMIDNQKRQITQLNRNAMELYARIAAMAKCLNLEFVPEKTIDLKYEKIETKSICVEEEKGKKKMPKAYFKKISKHPATGG